MLRLWSVWDSNCLASSNVQWTLLVQLQSSVSIVLPHLTYASCVWSPCYAIHRQSRVQHKFLKYAAFKMNIILQDDEQILSILGLPSVLVRLQIRDLQLLYNILHNRSSIPELLQKINIRGPLRVTRSTPSFFVPTHRTNYGHNKFMSKASRLVILRLTCFPLIETFRGN